MANNSQINWSLEKKFDFHNYNSKRWHALNNFMLVNRQMLTWHRLAQNGNSRGRGLEITAPRTSQTPTREAVDERQSVMLTYIISSLYDDSLLWIWQKLCKIEWKLTRNWTIHYETLVYCKNNVRRHAFKRTITHKHVHLVTVQIVNPGQTDCPSQPRLADYFIRTNLEQQNVCCRNMWYITRMVENLLSPQLLR